MTFQALLLVALGLSMDAFGASVSRGAAYVGLGFSTALRISLVFGAFATATPVLGWFLGLAFIDVISAIDHWIAFTLLVAVGVKMIRDARRIPDGPPVAMGLRLVVIFTSAMATSIDSGIFGITLPSMEVGLLAGALTVGGVTFAAAFAGLHVGRVTGAVAGRRAEVIGGFLLIVIGLKILLDHTLLAN